jgi:hypothetical protein
VKTSLSRKPAHLTAVGTIGTGIVPLPADLKSAKPQVMLCMIGLTEAERLLAINTANRKESPSIVARYTRDIEHGRFGLSNDAISVYTSGKLATGQHRAQAIIAAGKSILSAVMLGLPEEAAANLDQPATRRQHQNLQIIAGLRGAESDADAKIIAVARMLVGAVNTGLTMDELQTVLAKYEEPLAFVRPYSSCPSSFRAAVAAAHLHGVNPAVLARFCEVFIHNITTGPHESAAIRLGKKLPTIPGTNAGRIEQIKVTMNAIKFFAAGHDAKKLPVPDDYLYSLATLENI